MTNNIGDDDPIPLGMAADLFFRGQLTKSALRTEARKGNLEILRIANKDFVTRRAIQAMIEKCTLRVEPTPRPHLSVNLPRQAITSKEALRLKLQELKKKK
jgi:hypothetical protein